MSTTRQPFHRLLAEVLREVLHHWRHGRILPSQIRNAIHREKLLTHLAAIGWDNELLAFAQTMTTPALERLLDDALHGRRPRIIIDDPPQNASPST